MLWIKWSLLKEVSNQYMVSHIHGEKIISLSLANSFRNRLLYLSSSMFIQPSNRKKITLSYVCKSQEKQKSRKLFLNWRLCIKSWCTWPKSSTLVSVKKDTCVSTCWRGLNIAFRSARSCYHVLWQIKSYYNSSSVCLFVCSLPPPRSFDGSSPNLVAVCRWTSHLPLRGSFSKRSKGRRVNGSLWLSTVLYMRQSHSMPLQKAPFSLLLLHLRV